ncbi:MAG: type VI secretion system baseplate subunit TssK [Deltaproteobacteria bacterium]|nr:type VI secretion system baseplate subunit TssK [Deltaproteobacteria bacterium]
MDSVFDTTLERVIWTEGMLVSPQHLQQQALFNERWLAARLYSVAPYNWGVLRVEIDSNALVADQLSVTSFAGVFPDGTPISFHKGQQATPAAREIGQAFLAHHKKLRVFLGIAREREGIANVGNVDDEHQRLRYALSSRDVADLSSGRESRVLVSYGRPNILILFNDEANQDFDSIQIAEITRDEANQLIISTTYIPPCLQLGTSSILLNGLQKILGLAITRQRALAETCRERSSSTLEFQANDITAFLQLSALNSMLPVLQHFIDAPQISPWQAYILLSQIAGQLSTFGVDTDPTTLPKFLFTDLDTTYQKLFERLIQILSATVIKRYILLNLKLFPNGVMLTELEDPRLLDCDNYILTAKSEQKDTAPEKLAMDLPKLAKIGSKTMIKSIVQSASNGVPIQVAHRVPPEVPVRDGVTYFSLNTKDMAWKAVLNERNLAIFMPPPYNPGKVRYELLGIPSEE